jgi:hypothetical protein
MWLWTLPLLVAQWLAWALVFSMEIDSHNRHWLFFRCP